MSQNIFSCSIYMKRIYVININFRNRTHYSLDILSVIVTTLKKQMQFLCLRFDVHISAVPVNSR